MAAGRSRGRVESVVPLGLVDQASVLADPRDVPLHGGLCHILAPITGKYTTGQSTESATVSSRFGAAPAAAEASVWAVAGSTARMSWSPASREGLSVGQSAGDSPLTTRSAKSARLSGETNEVAVWVSRTVNVLPSIRRRIAWTYAGSPAAAMDPVAPTSMRFPVVPGELRIPMRR